MAELFVADFGKTEEGVLTYRINGKKNDLYRMIEEIEVIGFTFMEPPIVEKAHKHWSVLVKILLPCENGYIE